MDPRQMAGGGGGVPMPPPQAMQGQGMQGQSTPGQANVGGDFNKVLEALSMAVQQAVDGQGYVDLERLIAMWPQIAQQAGINIPFQTVWQLIEQNPSMVEDLIVRHGLAGLIVKGQRVSAEQLSGMGTGATGGRM